MKTSFLKLTIFAGIFLLSNFLFLSCSLFDKEEAIPAYIVIDSVSVITDLATEGSSSNNISDSWIYVGGKLIGAFENRGNPIPVLTTGSKIVEINPGIKENSSNSLRTDYSMMQSYKIDTVLKEGEILHIVPQYKYFDDVTFSLLENFDNGSGSSFLATEGSVPMRLVKDNDSFWNSLYFSMQDTADAFEIKTSNFLFLPKGGYDCYLEINYKCNAYFSFGFFDRYSSSTGVLTAARTEVFTFKPSNNQWKKVYVNMKTHLKDAKGSEFQPYFASTKKANPDTEVAEIYIDNIKIIHR